VKRAALGLVVLAVAFWALPAGAARAATWCGTVAPTDRTPQVGAGQSVHAVYVLPSDLPDRSAQVAQQLVDDAEQTDLWWRREDPTRTLRFDLFPFPCGPQLDITMVRVPLNSTALRPVNGRFERIVRAMTGAGLNSSFENYLVYYDGPSDPLPNGYQACGQGGQLSNGSGVSIVYLGACSGVPSAPTAVHELLHGLGAVPSGAPNACPNGDAAHVCDSVTDVMYPFASGSTLDELVLDAGHDDYYGHSGTWLDVQDSPWLVFLNSQVRLALELTGSGNVASDIPGVSCTASCTSDWNGGASVTLRATPAKGQRFVRWSGACTGSASCTIDLAQATTVSAFFARATYLLNVTKTGQGTVRGGRGVIACGGTCHSAVASFAPLTLTAVAAKGWRFRSWAGACRGTKPSCLLPMTAPATARAIFVKRR
jgi:Fe-S cluster biogenesis protein NfuA